ncbi:hypothetical protein HDU76_011294 [Blyttiomyces sp. JEL0837]|nr:hypothetical protein HDU76_011294 [Blyttiomyces sp. JEL0837]
MEAEKSDGTTTTIADLAAEHQKEERWIGKLPAIPNCRFGHCSRSYCFGCSYWAGKASTSKFDPCLGVTSWTPTTSNDTLLNKIGQTLLNTYGNYSKVPYNDAQTVTIETEIGDGQKWLLNTKFLLRPNNWLLVVAIPRHDFFSTIDAAQKRVLVISVTVGVIGVVLVGLASFFALRRLDKLTEAMNLLTKMDISALEGQ